MKSVSSCPSASPARALAFATLCAALIAPSIATATCSIATVNQHTVVTATVVLGLSEHCVAPIAAFPPPFTCMTEVIGERSGGTSSLHRYDTGLADLAECTTEDSILYCYADGAAPPSSVPFQCVAEIHRALLDLSPATAKASCGCASLKDAGR
ncbi:MAG: hypothetical protein ACREP7_15690 [Lysobacter sp.]